MSELARPETNLEPLPKQNLYIVHNLTRGVCAVQVDHLSWRAVDDPHITILSNFFVQALNPQIVVSALERIISMLDFLVSNVELKEIA